jgi:hypothetical protein
LKIPGLIFRVQNPHVELLIRLHGIRKEADAVQIAGNGFQQSEIFVRVDDSGFVFYHAVPKKMPDRIDITDLNAGLPQHEDAPLRGNTHDLPRGNAHIGNMILRHAAAPKK